MQHLQHTPSYCTTRSGNHLLLFHAKVIYASTFVCICGFTCYNWSILWMQIHLIHMIRSIEQSVCGYNKLLFIHLTFPVVAQLSNWMEFLRVWRFCFLRHVPGLSFFFAVCLHNCSLGAALDIDICTVAIEFIINLVRSPNYLKMSVVHRLRIVWSWKTWQTLGCKNRVFLKLRVILVNRVYLSYFTGKKLLRFSVWSISDWLILIFNEIARGAINFR